MRAHLVDLHNKSATPRRAQTPSPPGFPWVKWSKPCARFTRLCSTYRFLAATSLTLLMGMHVFLFIRQVLT